MGWEEDALGSTSDGGGAAEDTLAGEMVCLERLCVLSAALLLVPCHGVFHG
jgi:hypothetical protein